MPKSRSREEDVQQTQAENRKYAQALSAGGFVCFLPHVIHPAWEEPAPLLAGFPISVCFTGLGAQVGHQPVTMLTSCYWFDPTTYREDDKLRQMTYRTKPANEYSVDLLYHKRLGRWEGRKLCGGNILLIAEGTELPRFIIQLTKVGLTQGEVAQPLLTCADTASAGVYVFTPMQGSPGAAMTITV